MTCQRHRLLLLPTLLVLLLAACTPASVRSPMQASTPPAAAVASAHPLATNAGLDILAAGGNAFDAAVAVSATLAVVEPTGSGMGGGGFWLLYEAEKRRYTMVDGRETTPGKGHRDMYLDRDGKVIPGLSMDGALAAGIPGQAAALAHLAENYGRLPLSRSLAPAIRHARRGFQISSHYRRLAGFRKKALQAWQESSRIFLHKGEVPGEGFRLVQEDLARTLEALARDGRQGFYEGEVARKLVDGVREAGGIWTLEDLRNYRIKERQPIIGRYNGARIISAAPPSSGGVALLAMLNLLHDRPVKGLPPVARTHLLAEIMRRVYRDRAQYLGDPDFVEVPVAMLTSRLRAQQLGADIRMDQATPSEFLADPQQKGRDTSHFSILDKDGNRVAATLSINYPFGSGLVPAGTGVLLNNELDDFSAKPGVPNAYGLVGNEANAIAAGKRPLSSMSPTFMEDERGVLIIGTPGGSRIISMVFLGIVDYLQGGSAQSIVSLPRFHHQYLPDEIQYETGGLTPTVTGALEEMGHSLKDVGRPYGNMQAIIWDQQRQEVTAASDPRGEGEARVMRINP